MIHQPRQNTPLIADLVQMALMLADRCCGDLPDQCQHGGVHSVGREQGRARVEQARAGHHRIGLRFAGRQRRAERHITRTLLVPGVDDTQEFAGALKGIEQMVVVDTGQRVDGIEPVADEGRNPGLGRRHFDAGRLCLLFAGGL